MSELEENFERVKNTKSDINEHLGCLRKYANECEHITEMGVRWVASTWAFLAARPKKLVSYDIKPCDIHAISDLSKKIGVNFEFKIQNVLDLDIEYTDLLFIDTYHTYSQLSKELSLHSHKAKKYIILHDTSTYGHKDEEPYDGVCKFESSDCKKTGLLPAIQEFLYAPAGGEWFVREVFQNNNGLTVLERFNK